MSKLRSGSAGGRKIVPNEVVKIGSLVFAVGFLLTTMLISEGHLEGAQGWLRPEKENAMQGMKAGTTIMIQPECDWVQILVSSYPRIRWTQHMEMYCGSAAVIITADVSRGVVKCRHSDGSVIHWPIVATSILPKYPPSEFLSSRLSRASFHLDRIEKHLSTYNENKILVLLKTLSMTQYYKKMIVGGLDRLDVVVAAGEDDRKAAEISSSDWAVIQREAVKLQSQKDPKPVRHVPIAKVELPQVVKDKAFLEQPQGKAASPRKLGDIKTAHFIHIPKAGGTTATSALRSLVGCSVEPCLGSMDKHPPCPGLEGCYGHSPLTRLGVEKRTNGSTDLLVINVRKPVDRIVSAFHHGSREWPCCGLPQRDQFKKRLYMAQGDDAFTLTTFSQHVGTRNCMAKMLIGKECKAPLVVDKVLAQKGADLLELFNVVIIVEYMKDSLNLLSCVTGADFSGDVFKEKVRSGSYTEKGSPEEREAIAHNNEWDVMLYDKAIRQFCSIYKKHECSFALSEGLC
eukprot:TRINITY_DN1044_c0_g11_i1.p1 TRINITY_DN1044_c0_g11~~TRINITY_DN1044_c0_g11_i1.p1  ORF type:complete len:514 (+),score=60.74 TRINITY_DN1044_c0_g11_i1:160-1701(+)